jgi:hypothetical protein
VRKVESLLVEFGPPSRWQRAKEHIKDGLRLMTDMANEYRMEARVINSLVWQQFLQLSSKGVRNDARVHHFVALTNQTRRQQLIDGMQQCRCEACELHSLLFWATRPHIYSLETAFASPTHAVYCRSVVCVASRRGV